jgi:hypothetical protein
MATIGRANGATFNNTSRLSYIATAAFNTYFFSYSTSINASLETVGTLATVVGATPVTCPKGRVLRENGRKLYPGANPGVTTYLVGVYDAQSMLNGFIDPNAKVFQIYNTDKPNFLADGVSGTTDLGPSVYTRGDLLAEGLVDISGGLTVYAGETIKTGNLTVTVGNVAVTAGNVTLSGASAVLTLAGTDATVNLPDKICGTAACGGAGAGYVTTITVGVKCTTTAKIFIQETGTGQLRVTNVGTNQFTVTSTVLDDGQQFFYLIIE